MQSGFQTAEQQNGASRAPVEVAIPPAVEVYPIAESAEAALSTDTILKQIVPIPAWRRSVEIRALTLEEIETITLDAQRADDTGQIKADGRVMNRLFMEKSITRPQFTADQVAAMFSQQSAETTGTILEAIMRINGLGASFGLSVAAQTPATFRQPPEQP